MSTAITPNLKNGLCPAYVLIITLIVLAYIGTGKTVVERFVLSEFALNEFGYIDINIFAFTSRIFKEASNVYHLFPSYQNTKNEATRPNSAGAVAGGTTRV